MDVDSRVVGSTGGMLHYYFRNKVGAKKRFNYMESCFVAFRWKTRG